MNYEELKDWIENEMKMAPGYNYQPIMIRTLLRNDGKASREKIEADLKAVYSRFLPWKKTRYPFKILEKHSVCKYNESNQMYELLDFDEIQTHDQWKAVLVRYCNDRTEKGKLGIVDNTVMFSKEFEKLVIEFDKNRFYFQPERETAEERNRIRDEFVSKYPIEKISSMKLSDYATGVPDPKNPEKRIETTFCTMVEEHIPGFGGIGGTPALKFGIYWNKTEKKYVWWNVKNLNEKNQLIRKFETDKIENPTVDDAWNVVRSELVHMLKAGQDFEKDGDVEKFSEIDIKGTISSHVRSKFMAIYFPNHCLDIHGRQYLEDLLDYFGKTTAAKYPNDITIMQQELLTVKKTHPIMQNWSIQDYSHFLWQAVVDKEKAYLRKNTLDRSMLEENYSEDDRIIQVLRRKKNIILYGPPGTGKTFTAKRIADYMIGNSSLSDSADKDHWFEYLKKEITRMVPDSKIDTTNGPEYFSIISGSDEKRMYVSYGNKGLRSSATPRNNDSVEIGIKRKGIKWLDGVDLVDAFVIIVNLSTNSFVVLPYGRLQAHAKFRGGENWDSTGKTNMWFSMNALTPNSAVISADPKKQDDGSNRFDFSEYLFNLGLLFDLSSRPDLNMQKTFVTFHQSYGYEEFVEGIRPKAIKNVITYPIEPGVFKKICKQAEKSKDDFILIIDEINRGKITKIFGELISIIENDKRGEEITLAYSGKRFSVPENVYIIGTMNTADQSLTHIDAALKRRFSSIEVMPDSSILKEGMKGLPELLDKINDRIGERRSRDNQIGHAYFMHEGKAIKNIEELQFVFATDIIPLLRDYFYDDEDALKDVLGGQFIDWSASYAGDVKDDWQDDTEKFRAAIKTAYNVKI